MCIEKKVNGNISEYNTCHSCHGLLERNLLICCTEPDCKRYFCFRCLNKKFSKSPKMIFEINTSPSWSCVSCVGLCNCKMYVNFLLFTQSKYRFLDFSILSVVLIKIKTILDAKIDSLEKVKNIPLN